MMTEDELNEIEARLKATTPGKWFQNSYDPRQIRITDPNGGEDGFVMYAYGYGGGVHSVADTKFATEAHNRDMPALLAEVRRLREGLTFLSENEFLAADVNSHYAACVLDGTVNEEKW